jgi:hypothetical protein
MPIMTPAVAPPSFPDPVLDWVISAMDALAKTGLDQAFRAALADVSLWVGIMPSASIHRS